MPTYTYECRKGHQTEREYRVSEFPATIRCECGQLAKKIIVPVMMVVPEYMSARGDMSNSRARQQAFIAQPETKKKIMDGEYTFAKD